MKSSARRVVGMVMGMLLGVVIQSRAQERTMFIAEGRIGNAVIQSNVWQAGDFEYDLSTNTAAPAVQGHYPWLNGETVPFEVRYDAVSGRAQMQVGGGTNLVWTVPGEPLTSNGVVNIRLGGRGGNVAGNEDEYGLRLTDLQWETNGVVAVALTNTFVAVAGGGYQTGLISGLPAAAQWRLWGQVRMTWPDGTLPAHSQLAFQMAFTEPLQVVSVQWEQHVKPLTDNPAAQGGGLRMFAERDDPAAQPSVDNQTVTVKATVVPRRAGIRVYFASYDVDDPTANTAPVDAMDEQFPERGNDNRGTPQNGSFVDGVSFADTDANGEARVQLVVTTQPGDNFRVVATLDENELQRLGIYTNDPDSIYVPANSEPVLEGFNGRVSPLLTVWRTVHIEVDAMEPMPDYPNPESNFVGGYLSGNATDGYLINGVGGVAHTVYLDRSLVDLGPTDAYRDWSPNHDGENGVGNGRFEHGSLWIGTDLTTNLWGNGEFSVSKLAIDGGLNITFVIKKAGRPDITGQVWRLRNEWYELTPIGGIIDDTYIGATITVAGEVMQVTDILQEKIAVKVTERKPVIFWLHDDDDDTLLNPQNGQPHFPDTSRLAEALRQAFMEPRFIAENPHPTTAFRLNIRTFADILAITGEEFDSKAQNAPDFWVTRVVSANQHAPWGVEDDGSTIGDGDPGSEPWVGGYSYFDLNAFGIHAPCGMVFLETIREKVGIDREGMVVAHEVGHTLATSAVEPVTTCDATCPQTDPITYDPSYLDMIRRSPQPGGVQP